MSRRRHSGQTKIKNVKKIFTIYKDFRWLQVLGVCVCKPEQPGNAGEQGGEKTQKARMETLIRFTGMC